MRIYPGSLNQWNHIAEKGDVIATVRTDVDSIRINSAQIELTRLQERYQEAEQQMNEDLQDILDERALTYNSYKRKIIDIRYQQKQQDWELEKYNYENSIRVAKEELDKLTKIGSVYEVKAPVSGYVNYSYKYAAGMELRDGYYICHISNDNVVYATTTVQADRFHYGMEFVFDNRNGLTPGRAVSGGSWELYGNLDTQETIFRLEFEQDVEELDAAGLNNLVLKGNLRTMDNVILVPREAVTEEENEYFVTVLKEDGTLLKTEFVPGGSNVGYYWVLDGLTEGTKIVYN